MRLNRSSPTEVTTDSRTTGRKAERLLERSLLPLSCARRLKIRKALALLSL